MTRLAIILATALALTGCKTLEENQSGARLVVTYAVMKYVERGDTAEDRARKAQRIRAIASDVQRLASGDPVTLTFIGEAVRAQLAPLNLSPADLFLANELLNLLMTELQTKVGEGILDADQLVQVATVLGWVIEATAIA